MGNESSKEGPDRNEQESTPPKEDWVLIEQNQDGDGPPFNFKIEPSPTAAQKHKGPPPNEPIKPASIDRPAHLELPSSKPKLLYDLPTLPSIEEHPLESSSCESDTPSVDVHRQHYRTPSADSRLALPESSLTPSVESHPTDKSGTASIESTRQEKSCTPSVESRPVEWTGTSHLEHEIPGEFSGTPSGSCKLSAELPSDMGSFRHFSEAGSERGSGRPSPAMFQPVDLSVGVFQGNLVESILFEAKKAFRDDGLLTAVSHIQAHLDHEVDQNVSRSLLHEACGQVTDVYTFNVVVMNINKAMINHQNEKYDGRTPLHVACSHLPMAVSERTRWLEVQQKEKITKLLSLNTDTTLQDKDGNMALHLATFHNNADCVAMILNHDQRCINIGNNLGNTALHIACRENFVGVVKVLCDHKADARLPNRTKKQRCPLHHAISKGHTKVVEVLLKYHPGTVECVDGKRMQPLHLAVKRNCLAIAASLLRQPHCPLTTPDADGRTPLHYACEWGNLELVSMLLKRDSSKEHVNGQDSNEDTPLHLASRHGNSDVIKLLKSYKASKKLTNKLGETAKETAVSAGHRPPTKKSRSLGGLFKKKTDIVPHITSSSSLVSSSTSSIQTPPVKRRLV